MQPWQAEMRRLKIDHFKSISKEFYRVNGGQDMIVRTHTDKTAHCLMNCIMDYLGYHGHASEQGPVIKGYMVIRSNVEGRELSIVIRMKKTKDHKGNEIKNPFTPVKGQIQYMATGMEAFMNWFRSTFPIGSGLTGNTSERITA